MVPLAREYEKNFYTAVAERNARMARYWARELAELAVNERLFIEARRWTAQADFYKKVGKV